MCVRSHRGGEEGRGQAAGWGGQVGVSGNPASSGLSLICVCVLFTKPSLKHYASRVLVSIGRWIVPSQWIGSYLGDKRAFEMRFSSKNKESRKLKR
jgi:hypothetical protein